MTLTQYKTLTSGCLVLAVVLCPRPILAANFSWDAGSGNWSTAGNWSPAGPPDLGDTAMMGNLPGVENVDVFLDQNDAVQRVEITDGVSFGTNHHTFSVIGDTLLSGLNIVPLPGGNGQSYHHSRLYLEPSPALIEYTTDDLTLLDGASVWLVDGGMLEVRGLMYIDSSSSLYQEGVVRFLESGTALRNNGTIDPAGGEITLEVLNGGAVDLDGSTGDGQVMLDWGGEQLTIDGGVLADSFSGQILIDGDSELQMNLDAPWEADTNSEILLGRGNNGVHHDPSVISGVGLTLGGRAVVDYGAYGRFDAAVTYAPTADVEVESMGRLEMNGATEIEGGVFLLEEDADADFDGETEVGGGMFTTFSNLSSEGAVRFNGDTIWRGDVTVNGIALQNGDATVSAISNIDAGVFDMDAAAVAPPGTSTRTSS